MSADIEEVKRMAAEQAVTIARNNALADGLLKGAAGSAPSRDDYPTDDVEQLARYIIPLCDFGSHDEAPLPHIVDFWIPCNEVTLLAGHGGGGKSYIALVLAVHVALGRPFGELRTRQSNVLFFSAEDGEPVLRQRLARVCRALRIDPSDLVGKLFLLDASDIDPALHREQRVPLGDGTRELCTDTVLLGVLAALVNRIGAGLVVVDNTSDVFDDDEIRRARVRTFIRSLRGRIARPGRAVLLLAHVNKVRANQGKSAGSEDYSGSTAWHNSVRSRLSLVPADDGSSVTVEHAKANLGAKAPALRLEWHEGVPQVAGTFQNVGGAAAENIARAHERERDALDKAALAGILADFDRRGERVTTAVQGTFTVHRLLKAHADFPKATGADRLARLLREMETEGTLFRRIKRTADRKYREVFTCAVEPDGDEQSAPIPGATRVADPNLGAGAAGPGAPK